MPIITNIYKNVVHAVCVGVISENDLKVYHNNTLSHDDTSNYPGLLDVSMSNLSKFEFSKQILFAKSVIDINLFMVDSKLAVVTSDEGLTNLIKFVAAIDYFRVGSTRMFNTVNEAYHWLESH